MGEIAFVALTGLGTHFKKAVLCYGQGGSGKSQFLELVGRLVPKSAQCTVEPQQMGQDYHCAFLSGKALNMVTDLNGSDILHEGRFKAIVHGEPVPARQPRGEVYQLQPRALHLFNANALPPAPGATPAFWDRWLVIGFQKGWTGEQRQMLEGGVKDIAAAILAADMGGLLGWVIECGRDLMARGHYTLPKTAGEILGKWRGEGDSVAEWVSEQCERLDAKAPQSRWLEASIAYMNYRDWCKASGYQSVSIRTLKNRLESHGVVTRRASAGSIYAVALKADKLPPHF
jgi:putative DNA primase/helicase